MKYSFIVAEGSHDIEFLAQILKSYSLRRITKLANLDPYWDILVPRKFPIDDDLIQRVPVPTFFQNNELSVALHYAVGDSKLVRTVSQNLSILPVTSTTSGIGIILDADTQELPTKRFSALKEKLTDPKLNLTQLQLSLPQSPGVVTQGSLRCGIFVIPDNSSQGTLEDILIECAARNYPDLLNLSKNYIDNINTSLLTEKDLEEFKKSAGKNKAILSGITSILKPTRPLAASLQDNRWIDEETLKLDRLVAIRNFVGEIIGAL